MKIIFSLQCFTWRVHRKISVANDDTGESYAGVTHTEENLESANDDPPCTKSKGLKKVSVRHI